MHMLSQTCTFIPCRFGLLKDRLEHGMRTGQLSIPEGLPFLVNVNDASWCPVTVRALRLLPRLLRSARLCNACGKMRSAPHLLAAYARACCLRFCCLAPLRALWFSGAARAAVRCHALAALSCTAVPPTWVQGDGTSVCKAPLLSIFKSKWVQRQGLKSEHQACSFQPC